MSSTLRSAGAYYAATVTFAAIVTHVSGTPSDFHVTMVYESKYFCPTQLEFIDDERALLAHRQGTVYIAEPNGDNFPKAVYMKVRCNS